jgi:uridine kinase
VIIAIDGRAASGKTTLARRLADDLGAGIIHLDDFFLPPELRMPERLSQPGGNIHYERFTLEVLPFLRSGEAFSYRVFDCGAMDYRGERQVRESECRIVEGAYSHHPHFGAYAGLRIFADVTPKKQKERILKRNGPEALQVFIQQWIPMEEAYIRACKIQENAHIRTAAE